MATFSDEKLDSSRVNDVMFDDKSSSSQQVVIDIAAEEKLLRKVDLRVVPSLFLLFLLAFLDRTNIGNAKIQGLVEDLHMKGQDYNIALFIFFVPYILFEVPSNIIIKKVAPSTWLSLIMTLWGIATVGQGLVKNFGGLVACRFLVGLFEAGLFPGCVYIISMYYQRMELQRRLSLFFCASILAGAFGGLLAYALAKMAGIGGYNGWRIFIIEGLATIVIGIASKWFVPDWPETAKFLNEEERALLVARLSRDSGEATMNRLDGPAAKRVAKDWKIYVGIIAYLGVVNTGYATSFFIPTIIKELGYTSAAAQVRSIPIFIVATACAIAVAFATDRLRHRYAFTIAGVVIASIGYILLLCQDRVTVGVKYFAIFLVTSGGYMTQPVTIAWLSNNMSGHYKRSIASACQIGFGNIGGIIASNVFITKQAPKYPTGYGVSLGLMWACAAACTILFFGVRAENKKRDRGERDGRLEDIANVDNLGDDHPHFRFTT
ncbi:hypothetical protein B0A49_04513 [Cryomyces minteri]|uniref:Major facilitator superfamily (MFS) profile domain-containing protein n=1 Tax=Cryomyces minteri TaxID=331657 RepID=A0A4U0WUA8_9PEZI|nr:hypothetical protein B0A49_04513 [Cryomyces minteri]